MGERNEGFIKGQSSNPGNQEFGIGPHRSPFERGLENTTHEELVAGIRKTIAEERARFINRHGDRYGKDGFNPAGFIGYTLTPLLEPGRSKAERNLALAWEAIRIPYLEGQEKRGTQENMED